MGRKESSAHRQRLSSLGPSPIGVVPTLVAADDDAPPLLAPVGPVGRADARRADRADRRPVRRQELGARAPHGRGGTFRSRAAQMPSTPRAATTTSPRAAATSLSARRRDFLSARPPRPSPRAAAPRTLRRHSSPPAARRALARRRRAEPRSLIPSDRRERVPSRESPPLPPSVSSPRSPFRLARVVVPPAVSCILSR